MIGPDQTRSNVYIALGSNLGDRRANIDSAIADLRASPEIEVVAVSSLIETEPVGPVGQGLYLNAAAALCTSFSPRGLLDLCLAIEVAHGRDRRTQTRWGPRTLDIDLLLYEQLIIDEPGLRIPHPHMAERRFVLEPLAEIAPHALHPVLRTSIHDLLDQLPAGILE